MGDLVEGESRDSRDANTYVLVNGVVHRGMPPDATPEQRRHLNALFDKAFADIDEAHERPERFVTFRDDESAEHHRRGDAECVQGRCHGTGEGLPACPYGCGGLVHRPLFAGQAGQCDACDKPVLMPSR